MSSYRIAKSVRRRQWLKRLARIGVVLSFAYMVFGIVSLAVLPPVVSITHIVAAAGGAIASSALQDS